MEPPKFINRKKTNEYFLEVIAMIIYVIGFNYKVVQNKWQGTYKAFDGFDVEKVAKYNEKNMDKLLGNSDIIRNRRKIAAIINNAKTLREISKEHGSVIKWVNKLYKKFEKDPISHDHPYDVGKKTFEMVGEMTIKWFFSSAGKEIEE